MAELNRREFLGRAAVGAAALASSDYVQAAERTVGTRPNILLLMCDDLGYGDTGFNGNRIIRTPHLDALRSEGARFTRFYAGSPVCSPTRGTCLTGRHYFRYGITHANEGCLPRPELTIAEICRELGYRTGHFGKWHLGTMSKEVKDGNRGGPEHPEEFSPPWEHGFDTCFSTEALVPTWNPGITPEENGNPWGQPGTPWRCAYWNERGERITDNLDGDDSRVIVDRVESFILSAVSTGRPFLGVVWFHTPHAPVVAGPDHRALYADYSEGEQHYYGCVTAMDEQVGRINTLLKTTGMDRNTAIWFCSDNGPEGRDDRSPTSRFHGSTAGLRGRKRSLFNGGISVPALLKWPGVVPAGAEYAMPCSTLDYLPTIADALAYRMPDARPIDGISLMPLLKGERTDRPRAIPYCFVDSEAAMFGSPALAMIDNQYKFLTNLSADGEEDLCYNLIDDPGETRNLARDMPEYALQMRRELIAFVDSCRRSHHGEDYPESFTPNAPFREPEGRWK